MKAKFSPKKKEMNEQHVYNLYQTTFEVETLSEIFYFQFNLIEKKIVCVVIL